MKGLPTTRITYKVQCRTLTGSLAYDKVVAYWNVFQTRTLEKQVKSRTLSGGEPLKFLCRTRLQKVFQTRAIFSKNPGMTITNVLMIKYCIVEPLFLSVYYPVRKSSKNPFRKLRTFNYTENPYRTFLACSVYNTIKKGFQDKPF